MISVILVVCLSHLGTSCKEVEPSLAEPIGLAGCMVLGPRIGMEWMEQHPKWELKGWKCQIGRRNRDGQLIERQS